MCAENCICICECSGNHEVYVVFKGCKPGVYTTCMECNSEVSGYLGNLHSSYATRREAVEAYAHFEKLELGTMDNRNQLQSLLSRKIRTENRDFHSVLRTSSCVV